MNCDDGEKFIVIFGGKISGRSYLIRSHRHGNGSGQRDLSGSRGLGRRGVALLGLLVALAGEHNQLGLVLVETSDISL